MTVPPYCSSLSGETDPASEAADNTSSQIFLSRGVAAAVTLNYSSSVSPQTSFTSIRESGNVTIINKIEYNEMPRGRAMERALKHPDPLSKAESRVRSQKDAAIQVDLRLIKRHKQCHAGLLTPFNDTTDSAAVLSWPRDGPKNRMLSNDQMDGHRPADAHINTSNDKRPLQSIATVPYPSFDSALWSSGNPENPKSLPRANQESLNSPNESTSISLASQLPTEILQQIFRHLSPADFNSARRICRVWFIGSLEPSILKMMLRRGGWSSSMRHDLAKSQIRGTEYKLSDVWIMSKRIARECALGPDWTGNGLPDNNGPSATLNRSGFVHHSTINFAEVPVPQPEESASGVIFTASACGKFLMAANGCVVYIYELNRRHKASHHKSLCPGSLLPVTSIICPRRVLACSMDTSSFRYAIAVLLDGRVGLVCDIDPDRISPEKGTKNRHDSRADYSSEESPGGQSSREQLYSSDPSPNAMQDYLAQNNYYRYEPRFVFRGIATAVTSAPKDYVWHNAARVYPPEITKATTTGCPHWAFQISPSDISGQSCTVSSLKKDKDNCSTTMPIETGPRSVYNNLCSDDDPPRSVALCPQRRCVAFGCSAGIELHWVDALTGQDLNRWFPLTSPSDYLFFLPPRVGIDSAKKLRLISSSARPGERAAIGHRTYGRAARHSPFWDNHTTAEAQERSPGASPNTRLISRLRANTRSRMLADRTSCSDHYRAIPLDDGYHVLFTDPATGLLCLGSDGPIGGPTKLLRKIWFQGPAGAGGPVAYTGCLDPDSGVRVAAAYGSGLEQRVWFFSVPGDVFAANKGLPFVLGGPYTQAWSQGAGINNRNPNWVDWWPDQGLREWLDSVQDVIPEALPRTIWPVKIRGQEIGACPAIVDLTVHSGPSIIVWAFSGDGLAKSWRMNDGNNIAAKNAWISRDGAIHYLGDSEPRLSSSDADLSIASSSLYTQRSFDGTSSTDILPLLEEQPKQHGPFTESESQNGICDANVDLTMGDPSALARFSTWEYDSGAIKAVAYLHDHGGKLYRPSRRLGHNHGSIGRDFAEGPMGLTRIDVEIR